jgi:hypothetical protein
MDDLTGHYRAPLANGNQSAGNTVKSDEAVRLEQTATGSPGVNPPPPTVDVAGLPVLPDEQVPLNTPPIRMRPAPAGGDGFGPAWKGTSESGSGWDQT